MRFFKPFAPQSYIFYISSPQQFLLAPPLVSEWIPFDIWYLLYPAVWRAFGDARYCYPCISKHVFCEIVCDTLLSRSIYELPFVCILSNLLLVVYFVRENDMLLIPFCNGHETCIIQLPLSLVGRILFILPTNSYFLCMAHFLISFFSRVALENWEALFSNLWIKQCPSSRDLWLPENGVH
jgi:hypothetical protein